MLGRSIRRMVGPTHDCELCASAAEALEKIKAAPAFDVIICDVQMPRQSGLDLYAALPPALQPRVIFMSGDLAQDGARQFFATHDALRLDKPFTREVLWAAMARLPPRAG